MIRVGVVGASGLAGGDLIRLITQHPEFELAFLGGSSTRGRRIADLHPGLRLDAGLVVQPVTLDVADAVDVLILATPAPVSVSLAIELGGRVETLVDLSGAFRIKTPSLHDRWYPGAERPAQMAERFVYGVPELVGPELVGSPLISLPGCYATSMTLALAPLVLGLRLTLNAVVVDGKSGSSGGGLSLRTTDLHPLRDGAIAPYAPTGHRHAGEVTDFFGRVSPGQISSLSMSAYGVSHVRGLMTSSYVFADTQIDPKDLQRAYTRFYRSKPFVRVRRHDESVIALPDPQAVLGSNYCDVTVLYDEDSSRIVVLSALDNLVKGAAGQAIQAVNLRYSLPEELGLGMHPVMPA